MKDYKQNIALGMVLSILAAFFAASLLLQVLPNTSNNFLVSLGNVLYSTYGVSSVIIPLFLLIAAVDSFVSTADTWTMRKSMRLLTAVVPFFTCVEAEKLCHAIANNPFEDFAPIKIGVLLGITALLVVIELLLATKLADKISSKTTIDKVTTPPLSNSTENTVSNTATVDDNLNSQTSQINTQSATVAYSNLTANTQGCVANVQDGEYNAASDQNNIADNQNFIQNNLTNNDTGENKIINEEHISDESLDAFRDVFSDYKNSQDKNITHEGTKNNIDSSNKIDKNDAYSLGKSILDIANKESLNETIEPISNNIDTGDKKTVTTVLNNQITGSGDRINNGNNGSDAISEDESVDYSDPMSIITEEEYATLINNDYTSGSDNSASDLSDTDEIEWPDSNEIKSRAGTFNSVGFNGFDNAANNGTGENNIAKNDEQVTEDIKKKLNSGESQEIVNIIDAPNSEQQKGCNNTDISTQQNICEMQDYLTNNANNVNNNENISMQQGDLNNITNITHSTQTDSENQNDLVNLANNEEVIDNIKTNNEGNPYAVGVVTPYIPLNEDADIANITIEDTTISDDVIDAPDLISESEVKAGLPDIIDCGDKVSPVSFTEYKSNNDDGDEQKNNFAPLKINDESEEQFANFNGVVDKNNTEVPGGEDLTQSTLDNDKTIVANSLDPDFFDIDPNEITDEEIIDGIPISSSVLNGSKDYYNDNLDNNAPNKIKSDDINDAKLVEDVEQVGNFDRGYKDNKNGDSNNDKSCDISSNLNNTTHTIYKEDSVKNYQNVSDVVASNLNVSKEDNINQSNNISDSIDEPNITQDDIEVSFPRTDIFDEMESDIKEEIPFNNNDGDLLQNKIVSDADLVKSEFIENTSGGASGTGDETYKNTQDNSEDNLSSKNFKASSVIQDINNNANDLANNNSAVATVSQNISNSEKDLVSEDIQIIDPARSVSNNAFDSVSENNKNNGSVNSINADTLDLTSKNSENGESIKNITNSKERGVGNGSETVEVEKIVAVDSKIDSSDNEFTEVTKDIVTEDIEDTEVTIDDFTVSGGDHYNDASDYVLNNSTGNVTEDTTDDSDITKVVANELAILKQGTLNKNVDGVIQNNSGSVQNSSDTKKEYERKLLNNYYVPSSLLQQYANDPYWIVDDETKADGEKLHNTLKEFNIEAKIIGIKKGPVVTMFELFPAPGVKLSKIVALQDNIALSLAASSVRIVAPIPGKAAVGIEVPNKHRSIVGFREIIEEDLADYQKMAIPVVLGKDILGKTQVFDLVKTPHLIIAGATGAGKSVCVNTMILSILFKRSPEQVKMILVDPKVVELKLYNDIPHLLTQVITEPKKAVQALQYCICEMERRYSMLDKMKVRDIASYNNKIREQGLAMEKMPYIVVIIDEFADLMATTGKGLETIISRLCAKSRAAGIHLVLATQRPSIDVITGTIKANIPSRIAFMVASKMDSRIIIDQVGAEMLLGKGDMLYASAVDPYPVRIQGTYVSDEDAEKAVEYVKCYGEPQYIDDEIFIDDEDEEDDTPNTADGPDELYDDAVNVVMSAGKASASYIQRKLKIGYNRAARLVEDMEAHGLVGPANGSKPRELLHIPD